MQKGSGPKEKSLEGAPGQVASGNFCERTRANPATRAPEGGGCAAAGHKTAGHPEGKYLQLACGRPLPSQGSRLPKKSCGREW